MRSVPTGDELATLELKREDHRLHRLARSLVFDEAVAEDIVQEARLRALERPPQHPEARSGWLATIVRNLASNHRREAVRRSHRERAVARQGASASSTEVLTREESRRELVEAVRSLPEPYREAILLRYFEGWPPRRIAAHCHAPRGTVATRLKRGLSMLRERLDARHGGDRRAWCLACVPLLRGSPGKLGSLLSPALNAFGGILTVKFLVPALALVCAVLFFRGAGSGGDGPDRAPAPADRLATTESNEVGPSRTTRPITTDPFRPPLDRVEEDAGAAPEEPSVLASLAGYRGRLVDPEGRPLAGRRVELLSVDPLRSLGGVGDPLGSPSERLAVPIKATRSQSDGAFFLRGIWPRTLNALHADPGGQAPTFRLLSRSPAAAEIVDLGDVVLDPRGGVSGRVVDDNGEAVADATVWATDLPGALFGLAPADHLRADGALLLSLPALPEAGWPGAETYHDSLISHLRRTVVTSEEDSRWLALPLPEWGRRLVEHLPRPRTRTDASGRFTLQGLDPTTTTLVVDAGDRGHLRRPLSGVENGSVKDLGEVEIESGDVIEVEVVTSGGEPVVEATVRAAPLPDVGMTGILFAGAARPTDAAGHATVTGLVHERVMIAVQPAPGRPHRVVGPVDLGETVRVVLPARHDRQIVLRTASPVAPDAVNLRLHQGPPAGEFSLSGLNPPLDLRSLARLEKDAATGGLRLQLSALPPEIYTLTVQAPGHALLTHVFHVDGEAPEEPETVSLVPADALSLRIVDPDLRPVAGARISVRTTPVDAWARSALFRYAGIGGGNVLARSAGRSDAEGRLDLHHLGGERADLVVHHPAWGTVVRQIALPADEMQTLAFEAPGTIEGRLFDDGRPASPEAWRVTATPQFQLAERLPAPGVQATIDEEGRFRFTGLTPGRHEIEVERSFATVRGLAGIAHEVKRRWGWPQRTVSREVTVVSLRTVHVEFDCKREGPPPGATGSVLEGRVVIDGAPTAGLPIRIGSSWGKPMTTTDSAGAFRIEGLESGVVSVTVGAARTGTSWWSGEVNLPWEGTERLDLDLRTAVFAGRLLDAQGNPAPDHRVSLIANHERGGTARRIAVTDAEGRFRVQSIPGEGTLMVRGTLGRLDAPYRLRPGDDRERELTLSHEGMILGRIVGPKERLQERLSVAARSLGAGFSWTIGGLADENGRFALGPFDPGTYQVFITGEGDLNERIGLTEVVLTAKGVTGVELSLEGSKR